jgi:3-keto-5-aminohexanoate cleavage enzyme
LYEHLPRESTWFVIEVGKSHLPRSMMAKIMGGHVRVGMEDNVYYKYRVLAKTNAELVERIVRIAKEYGRNIASPVEAPEILVLGKTS